jgi:seryl-tRNA synthetase
MASLTSRLEASEATTKRLEEGIQSLECNSQRSWAKAANDTNELREAIMKHSAQIDAVSKEQKLAVDALSKDTAARFEKMKELIGETQSAIADVTERVNKIFESLQPPALPSVPVIRSTTAPAVLTAVVGAATISGSSLALQEAFGSSARRPNSK